ncbi:MAG: hypothetical protein GVY18_17880 [Bacteroidetes bacterium]|jgi:hypothetical protein|nr:hypothetical protein [Bacteroidota bacterium]
MKRLSLLLFVLLLLGATAASVQLDFFRVEVQDNDFVITWQTRVEEDVRAYELHRKTSYSQQFAPITEVTARGANVTYRYVDDEVYKAASEQVDYKLIAVYTNGTQEQVTQRQVNYTPTAVRRTWGSIKAMFQ